MSAALIGTVGHGSTALWYLTRASGLVSLLLLSATVVLGTVASVGWTGERWPRFLSQSVHRNLSLFCLVFIAVHILSTVADGYVPIGLADAIVPFRSPYRPIWVGLGALAFDMLLAVAITSALRRRIGTAAWRGMHWLAYACWPIAVVHGLGSGSDARLPGSVLVFLVCVGAVSGAVLWRLVAGRAPTMSRRLAGIVGVVVGLVVIAAFALVGPLRTGWSHRAGTSPALLAQISGASTASFSGTVPTSRAAGQAVNSAIPAVPFSTPVSGQFTTSAPDADGNSQVTLSIVLRDTSVPLQIRIAGPAENGGVAMRRSSVVFGSLHGQVTALEGSNIGARVDGPTGPIELSMSLSLDAGSGTLTGQLSGSTPQ
jgi:sulfoxide reductase heme-binding subunit YedZ